MMKTPEEIKHGLECCASIGSCISDKCEYYSGGSMMCIVDLVRDALEYINELEVKVPRWISVNDILPDKGGDFLVRDKGGVIGVGYYAGTWYSCNTPYRITHWMPLPEPPKEDA